MIVHVCVLPLTYTPPPLPAEEMDGGEEEEGGL